MCAKELAAKYGLQIETEHFEGLVFVFKPGDESGGLGYCKVFTAGEIESLPNLEEEFAEIAVRSLWEEND